MIVSIHTPTQGVTSPCWIPGRPIRFQSTHPRRVWLIISYKHAQSVSFNPHTHAGCDRSGRFTLCCSMDVSIHTPTQGVTDVGMCPICSKKFQSTHPRRVWLLSMLRFTYKDVSIHTPTQGVTMEYFLQYARYRFQSTHPRRVWLYNTLLLLRL